jgi:AcrR family transcriptional regulator
VAKRPAKSRKRRPRQSAIEVRNKILDVALQMFADHAYEAVSLRALTIKAKVNVAAPHYYFGSKVKLFAEVFGRCMEPVNRERLRLLEEHMNGAGQPTLAAAALARSEGRSTSGPPSAPSTSSRPAPTALSRSAASS